ncbi:unnamed protein product [Sphagnum balticum]
MRPPPPSLQSSRALCSVVASNIASLSAIVTELMGVLQHRGLRRCVVVRHRYSAHRHFATTGPPTLRCCPPSLQSSWAFCNVVAFNICPSDLHLFDIHPSMSICLTSVCSTTSIHPTSICPTFIRLTSIDAYLFNVHPSNVRPSNIHRCLSVRCPSVQCPSI